MRLNGSWAYSQGLVALLGGSTVAVEKVGNATCEPRSEKLPPHRGGSHLKWLVDINPPNTKDIITHVYIYIYIYM